MNSLSILIFTGTMSIALGFQSFAPGGYNFPGGANIPSTPGINGGNDRGTWNIGVNKDKGRGPQIHADGRGNIYTSPNGNWQIDAGGSWDAGRGRKPSYGGDISVTGRWRRSADPYAPGGYNFPGNNGGGRIPSTPGISGSNDKGTWNIGVNKDKGRGPQIHADGRGNVYTSPNGNVQAEAGGRWDAGRGRKPTYGGDVNVHGRWRRDADPKEPGDRGSISVTREQTRGQRPVTTVQGNVRVWESRDKRGRVEAYGNVQRQNGRTSHGGGITYTHRFKREADSDEYEYEPEEESRVARSADLMAVWPPLKKTRFPIFATNALPQRFKREADSDEFEFEYEPEEEGRVPRSADPKLHWPHIKKPKLPHIGGGVFVSGSQRFKRDADEDEYEYELEEEGRVPRSADPKFHWPHIKKPKNTNIVITG